MPTKGDPGYRAQMPRNMGQLQPISGDPNAPQAGPGGMQKMMGPMRQAMPQQGMGQPRPQMPQMQRPFPGRGMQQGGAQPRPWMPQMQPGMDQARQGMMRQQMPQQGMGQMMQGMGQQGQQQDPQQQMAMLRMLLQRLQGGGDGGGQMTAPGMLQQPQQGFQQIGAGPGTGPQMSIGTGQNGMYW